MLGTIMHILSIEDDRDTQANLLDILELDGFRVDAATTLQEALARECWSEYAAILLDRNLPDGTADEFLPRLKQLAPEAAVIIVTGYADMDGTISALRHGAADYILKPIHPEALRMSLARVMKLQEAEKRVLQSERLAAIGQMVAAITHENRNALQRIQAGLEVLRLSLGQTPDLVNILERIHAASHEIQSHFEEVRGFSAPVKLEPKLADVSAVWREAWQNLNATWKTRMVEFQEFPNGVDLNRAIDAARLEQVFRNLFENALAACTDPVRIEIHCAETTLAGSSALRIAVRDNGPGLTQEQKRKVFEAFYTTKSQGMGLGMAIVKRIAEAHRGTIEVGNGGNEGRSSSSPSRDKRRPRSPFANLVLIASF